MTIKQAMTEHFARRIATSPDAMKTCDTEDVDAVLFLGEEDEEGYVEWRPAEKTAPSDFADIEDEAGVTLHPSIKEYFNAYWFMSLGGRLKDGDDEESVTLTPVKPGIELDEFREQLLGGEFNPGGYLAAHDGQLRHVPIGLHHPSDLLVVVDNTSGAVAVEDHERGTYRTIAPTLADLISRLT